MALTIAQIRDKYPSRYQGISDKGVLEDLHSNYYKDMPIGDLAKAMGYEDNATQPEEAGLIRSYAGIPFLKGTGDIGGSVGYALKATGVAPESGQTLMDSAAALDKTLTARQSQQAQEDAKKPLIDDNGNYGGYNAGSFSQSLFGSAPAMLAMAAPGGLLAKAAEKGAAAMGAGEKAAQMIGNAVGFGSSEGAVSGASNAAATQQEIQAAPYEKLFGHPDNLKVLRDETSPDLPDSERMAQAQEIIAQRAANQVMGRTFASTGGLGAVTGGGFMGMLRSGTTGSLPKRLAEGFVKEGIAQEAPQSAAEQTIQNLAKKDYLDPNQDPYQGTANAAATGAAVGGFMGLGGGFIAKDKALPDPKIIGAGSFDEAIAGFEQSVNQPAKATGRTPSSFHTEINHLLATEGGLSTNPADKGGITNYGISQRAYPNIDIKNLTPEQAAQIYKRDYWDKIGGDNLPHDLAAVLFDTAVNHGVGTAKQMLKDSGGNVGLILDMRAGLYKKLADNPGQQQFYNGWMARIANLRNRLGAEDKLAATATPYVTPDFTGTGPMGGIPQDNTPETKPPGQPGDLNDSLLNTVFKQPEGQPTHESADGQPLWQLGDNTYQDQHGNEVADDYATPIPTGAINTPEGINEQGQQAENETPGQESAAQAGIPANDLGTGASGNQPPSAPSAPSGAQGGQGAQAPTGTNGVQSGLTPAGSLPQAPATQVPGDNALQPAPKPLAKGDTVTDGTRQGVINRTFSHRSLGDLGGRAAVTWQYPPGHKGDAQPSTVNIGVLKPVAAPASAETVPTTPAQTLPKAKIVPINTYHPAIEGMVKALSKGGGVAYTTNQHGTITGRTPSLNPAWYQDWALTKADGGLYSGRPSVTDVQKAFDAYQKGSLLTGKQQVILQSLSDMAQGEEDLATEQWTAQQQATLAAIEIDLEAMAEREAIQAVNDAADFDDFIDNLPGFDHDTRTKSPSEATATGGQGQDHALPQTEVRQPAVYAQEGNTGTEEGFLTPTQALAAKPPKAPAPAATTDLFATQEEQTQLQHQQALADKAREKDQKRNGTAADGGELFQQPGIAGQTDIQDQNKPEPWQLTRKAYIANNHNEVKPLGRQKALNTSLLKTMHKRYVREALKSGKTVSKEVLADYPDLTVDAKPDTSPASTPAEHVSPKGENIDTTSAQVNETTLAGTTITINGEFHKTGDLLNPLRAKIRQYERFLDCMGA